MFRESDVRERNHHPTYLNKPVSTLQAISQASKFDDNRSTGTANVENQPLPVIPTTWDTYYDPSHRDADWSGLVSVNNDQRKHSSNHSSQQIGIVHSDLGIVSKVERQEWAHRRPPENNNVNQSSLVIGGISNDSDRWKTSYKSFEEQDRTSREQLILEKRMRSIKHVQNPYQQQPIKADNANVQQQTSSTRTNPINHSFSKQSMLSSSLASDIAASIDPRPQQTTVTPRARGADSLLSENYNPFPGEIMTWSH